MYAGGHDPLLPPLFAHLCSQLAMELRAQRLSNASSGGSFELKPSKGSRKSARLDRFVAMHMLMAHHQHLGTL